MPRVSIRPATVEELQNALNNQAALADAIGGPVPDDWPEKVEMFKFAAAQLKKHPDKAEWRLVYLFFDEAGILVGSGGYLGSPTGERPHRIVEIGYEIAPAFQGQGLGTAAVSELVKHARDSGAVDGVIARTERKVNPSVKILRHLKFKSVGLVDPPDGKGPQVVQWQLELTSR
jgi:ribosomal-protein-alanine N-acetyltransferase